TDALARFGPAALGPVLAALLALGRLRDEEADAAIRGAVGSDDPRIGALARRLMRDRSQPPPA
ncbi:MAG TPA: hypothetical protein VFC06_04655, partial [Demequina sp.]|nr:hypothetical protein [Demequina sp.]